MLNFYAYVDGADLEECEVVLTQAFSSYAAVSGLDAKVINDKCERTADLGPEDLPDWNLGLNFSISALSEIIAINLVSFLADLSRQTGREFVIGQWDRDKSISDDLMFIGADSDRSKGAALYQMVNER